MYLVFRSALVTYGMRRHARVDPEIVRVFTIMVHDLIRTLQPIVYILHRMRLQLESHAGACVI
jgi:hypothetical protein